MLPDREVTETAFVALFRTVAYIMALLGGLGTVGMMALINIDVVGRGAFGIPFPATAEIISASIVSVVFLQLPYSTFCQRNVRSDILLDRLLRRNVVLAKRVDGIQYAIGALMAVVLSYYAIPEIIEIIEGDETVGISGVLSIPRWPFVLPVLAGMALTALAFLIISARLLTDKDAGDT